MSKIVLCATDGGAHSALAPVVEPLRSDGHELVWATESGSKVAGNEAGAHLIDNGEHSIDRFLAIASPDVVLAGVTGLRQDLAMSLSKAAMARSVPVVKVIDFYGTGMPHEKGFAVDRLCVLDEATRDYEARMRNMPLQHIIATGSPAFDALTSTRPIAELVDDTEPLMLFVGPSSAERVMELWHPLSAALRSLPLGSSVVRLGALWHPASKSHEYASECLGMLSGVSSVKIIDDQDLRKQGANDVLLASSNLVVGATSTELVRACCLQVPALSIVFPGGLNFKDILGARELPEMPTTSAGATLGASDPEEVRSILACFFEGGADWKRLAGRIKVIQASEYPLDGKNTSRVADAIRSVL